ncbi:MAG: sigma-70 family RNA polymerase sigma factor [Chloroflexota bacterium]
MSPSTFPSSESLYNGCLSDNPAVREMAYDALWLYLKRVALKAILDPTDIETRAEDFAQATIERVFVRINECRNPKAFKGWAARITTNMIIDTSRREGRLVPLPDDADDPDKPTRLLPDEGPLLEATVLDQLTESAWREALNQAPISPRSRRVVVGRFLDGKDDATLAQEESDISQKVVKPSHIQVTRTKNMGKLRDWEYLHNLRER